MIAVAGGAQIAGRIERLLDRVLVPPPTLHVSQWADARRRLSPEFSAEPGPWRTDRVPYLRAIMDALGDERIREVVFAKAAQVGASSCSENWLGYVIDQDPSAVLVVWPTDKALRAWSKNRLDPLIRDTPCLTPKFPKSKRQEKTDTIARKSFPGGYLTALTAGSTADLRSHSARRAIAEEIDEWEADVGEQGDPLSLLRARLRTFWNRKLYMLSTPTIAGFSRIWRELEASTWHEYWVPCPHCRHMQTLRWQDEEPYGHVAPGTMRLRFDRDAGGSVIPGSTEYICEHCAALIPEWHKPAMLAAGEWRPRFPGRSVLGFHINTLYSPFVEWDDIATDFLRSKDSPLLLKTWVNTFLGLPFEETGEKIDAHYLSKRVEAYPKILVAGEEADAIPMGVGVLTAGVDVQGDRLEVLVWGYGANDEKWAIEWRQLHGDPEEGEVWAELDQYLLQAWRHESGASLRIAACAIDAHYQSERVHRFCEVRSARRVIPVIGVAGRGRQLLTAPTADKYKRGKHAKKAKRPTYTVGVDSAKDLLVSQLRVSAPGPGYIHFPDTVDPVLFDQLTSEKLVVRFRKGRPVREWVLQEHRRNEALDCSVYAEAALAALGPKVRLQLEQLVHRVQVVGAKTRGGAAPSAAGSGNAPAAPAPPAGARKGRRILRSSSL